MVEKEIRSDIQDSVKKPRMVVRNTVTLLLGSFCPLRMLDLTASKAARSYSSKDNTEDHLISSAV